MFFLEKENIFALGDNGYYQIYRGMYIYEKYTFMNLAFEVILYTSLSKYSSL